jgi:hypothetical protein
MDLAADATLAFPRPLVFATYRDHLLDVVEFLPNIRAIEIKSRKEQGPIVELLNVWHGGGEIPAAARAFISEAMLSWDDHARWDESDFTCHWKIVTHSFTEAVRCEGTNRYLERDGQTTLQIRGSLTIDPSKVRGVPRLLAGSVGRTVEEVLGKKIQPNLADVCIGVRKFLEAKAQG